MAQPRRIAFTFDERSLEPLESLQARGMRVHAITVQHEGQEKTLLIPEPTVPHSCTPARIAPGRSCDCCGARELTGGCVRGVLPCTCDRHKVAPAPRFEDPLFAGYYGLRCRECQKCPEHCGCVEEPATS